MTPARVEARRRLTEADGDPLLTQPVPTLAPTAPRGPVDLIDADTGHPVAYVRKAPPDAYARVKAALSTSVMSSVLRSGGVRSKSRTFGYAAPNAILHRRTPSASSWAVDQPAEHAAVCSFADDAWALMEASADERVLAIQRAARASVLPDWRMGDTPWTSGIVNDTVPLYYHRDRNNIRGAWSAMLVVRAGVDGGHLHIADYDVTLPTADGDVLFFPGVDLVHGVTPITRRIKGGYRFTCVYYPVKYFVGLHGPDEAREEARRRTTEQAATLIQRQRAEGIIR